MEVGGRGGWRQAEDESRRRATPIKNDSRWRTRQGTERKTTDYAGRGERQKTTLTGEMEELEKKIERSIIEAGRREEPGGGSQKKSMLIHR